MLIKSLDKGCPCLYIMEDIYLDDSSKKKRLLYYSLKCRTCIAHLLDDEPYSQGAAISAHTVLLSRSSNDLRTRQTPSNADDNFPQRSHTVSLLCSSQWPRGQATEQVAAAVFKLVLLHGFSYFTRFPFNEIPKAKLRMRHFLKIGSKINESEIFQFDHKFFDPVQQKLGLKLKAT